MKHCETCSCDGGTPAASAEPPPAITIDGTAIIQAIRDAERQTGRRLLMEGR